MSELNAVVTIFSIIPIVISIVAFWKALSVEPKVDSEVWAEVSKNSDLQLRELFERIIYLEGNVVKLIPVSNTDTFWCCSWCQKKNSLNSLYCEYCGGPK